MLLALSAILMSCPPPNVGPKLEDLKIACGGNVTLLLNDGSPSLLRREKINALEVEPQSPLEPNKTKQKA